MRPHIPDLSRRAFIRQTCCAAVGTTGLLSFGHALFVALGAYTAAYLTTNLGVRHFELIVAGAALAAVVVIGGLGSMRGAFAGSLIVGLLKAGAIATYPEVEMLAVYVVVIAVLVLRPAGLFARVAA